MLLQELIDEAHEDNAEDNGEHGAVIADGSYGDAEEVKPLYSVDAGEEQNCAEKSAEVGVGVELLGYGEADEDRQEVEGRLIEAIEDLISAGVLRNSKEGGEQGEHSAGKTSGNEDGDDGRERAADKGHRLVENAALLRLGVRLESLVVLNGSAALEIAELRELLVKGGYVLADNVLILSVLNDEVQNSGDLLPLFNFDLARVLNLDAKAGHAVADAGYVLRAAHGGEHAFRDFLVILYRFCHYFCTISFPQFFPLDFIRSEYQ